MVVEILKAARDVGVRPVIERVWERVNVDEIQFNFMPCRGNTDAFSVLDSYRKIKKWELYFVFVDLEKGFHRLPGEVLQWAMRKIGIEEWIVGDLSDEFSAIIGIHQGSVLSPLLLIMVLSRAFSNDLPWELLVLVTESQSEVI